MLQVPAGRSRYRAENVCVCRRTLPKSWPCCRMAPRCLIAWHKFMRVMHLRTRQAKNRYVLQFVQHHQVPPQASLHLLPPFTSPPCSPFDPPCRSPGHLQPVLLPQAAHRRLFPFSASAQLTLGWCCMQTHASQPTTASQPLSPMFQVPALLGGQGGNSPSLNALRPCLFVSDVAVESGFLDVAVLYSGQPAGLQTFSICDVAACPLAPHQTSNWTVSMKSPELPKTPELPVSTDALVLWFTPSPSDWPDC